MQGFMNLHTLKRWSLLPLLLLLCSSAFADSFQGYIEFTWTKNNEATQYKYYVKGDNIRIEEVNESGGIEGVMLVNTTSGTAYALSPAQKLYSIVNNKAPAKLPGDLTKGSKSKTIAGYDCTEYTVVNKDLDRKCHYFVAHKDFDFFLPLIDNLKRKENLMLFYPSIPNAAGGFPMIGEETDLAGNLIMRLEVTKVVQATIGDDLFVLPSDYTEFKKGS